MDSFEKRKLIFWLIGGFLLLTAILISRTHFNSTAQVLGETTPAQKEVAVGNLPIIANAPLPERAYLNVLWASQAPLGIWDDWHDETCEEGSVLLVHYYLTGQPLSSQQAEKELQDMVAFQIANMGEQKNLTAQETIDWLIKKYYGHKKVRIVYDITLDDIKRELADGHPVIVPAAGRELKNPHFSGIGPLYHMFVIKGYEPGWFITNEIGTRVGKDYKYNPQIMYDAIHDWNGGDVANGRKVMIVIEK